MPAPARCISRAITKRSVVSRESRSTAGVITTSPEASFFINLASCGRSAVVPVIFSQKYSSAPGGLQLLDLASLVLGGRRDACIAVNHVFVCIRNLHQKRSIFSMLRF